jgi:surfeit locus 1 family protein
MVSLGFWQLDRAEFKDALQQKIVERKNLTPVDLNELPESSEQRRYYPVRFYGEFDTEHNFLLDNKVLNGDVGYHVFTPVKVDESKIILVNRGFLKQGKSRDNLPAIETPGGKIMFRGLLDLTPPRALVLAENTLETTRWPIVLQYIDLDEIEQILGYQLYDMVLWLDQDQPGSLEYDLPVLNLNSAKNNGYAFQWFAMSLALLLIYVVVNTKRRN